MVATRIPILTGVSMFFPESYGALGNGTHDDTDGVLLADAAAAMTGGTVYFTPGKVYRCNGALALTNDAGTVPKQRARRWTTRGGGPAWSGTWAGALDVSGSAVLDLRYSGADGINAAKIDTRGEGFLEIDHLVIKSGGGDNFPLFQTTNTTCFLHHNAWIGNAANTGTACLQDAIIFGGTSTSLGLNKNAPFQGYGSKVHDNYFSHIRRGFVGQAYCNQIPVENNTFSTSCGNSGATTMGGAIEFIGNVDAGFVTGCSTRGNTIEVNSYKYGVAATWAVNGNFGPDGMYDPVTHTAAYHMGPQAMFNLIIDGYHNDTFGFVDEDSSVTDLNTRITAHATRESLFAQPVRFAHANGTIFSTAAIAQNGAAGFLSQPTGDPADTRLAFEARRSASAASNPGTLCFQVQQSGNVIVGGVSAGNVTFQNAAGTSVMRFISGRTWESSGVGGAMLIDSGSGGSFITLKGYGVKLLDYLGTNTVTLKCGTGTPENNLAAPVGSLFLRVDGGAGTTLYVKETGTGNTGWVAK